MIKNLVGVWLPKEANIIFKDNLPHAVVLMRKNEDGKYQLLLGNTDNFKSDDYEQFFIVEMPFIPEEKEIVAEEE